MKFNAGLFTVVPILVSSHLGRGEIDKAKQNANKLLGIAFVNSLVLGLLMSSLGLWFPNTFYSHLDTYAKDVASYFLYGLGFNFILYSFSYQMIVIVRLGPNQLLASLSDQLPFYIYRLPLLIGLLFTNLYLTIILLILSTTGLFQITPAALLYKYSNWAQKLESKDDKSLMFEKQVDSIEVDNEQPKKQV